MNKIFHIDVENGFRGGQRQTLLLMKGLAGLGIQGILGARTGSEVALRAKEMDLIVEEIPYRFEYDPFAMHAIHRLVSKHQIKLLHAHSSHSHGLACTAVRLSRSSPRSSVVVHRRVDDPPRSGFLNRIKYSWPDRYIAISPQVKQVLVDFGVPKAEIEVIGSGVPGIQTNPHDREKIRDTLEIPSGAILIGNVAHFVSHKGHSDLITAFAELRRSHRDVFLCLVGGGELHSALINQIKKSDLVDYVKMPGIVGNVAPFYSAFDMYVQSSRTEGLGTAVLDAFSAKIPVVSTTAGGLSYIVVHGETGISCPPADPSALARAMATVLEYPQITEKRAERAYELWKTRHSVEVMSQKVADLYARLCSF